MKCYIVKTVTTATNLNKNFAGEVHTYYHGRGDTLLAAYGTHSIDFDLTQWLIDEYGYERESDARRNWSFKHPENSKYWTSVATVVAAEVDGHSFTVAE